MCSVVQRRAARFYKGIDMSHVHTQDQTSKTSPILLRLPAILKKRGRSRSAHYADIKAGLFVKPVLIGLRATATPEHEVNALNAARIAGKSDDEIRELVKQLEAARKAAC